MQRAGYDELQSNCITVAPIKDIAQAVASRLNTIAAEEITNKINALTRQAYQDHQDQMEQDSAEERQDNGDAIRCEQEKRRHNDAISRLRNELLMVEGLYTIHELTRSRSYAAERQEWAFFFKYELDTNRIYSAISNHQSEIDSLSQQETVLRDRKVRRSQRRQATPMSRAALSSGHVSPLDDAISRARNETNVTCSNMMQTVMNKCHQTFLSQLDARLSELTLLTVNQKNALMRIIEKMNEHLNDLAVRQLEEDKLSALQNSLLLNQRTLANKQGECDQLEASYRALENSNQTLGATLGTLKSELNSLQDQRNFYAKLSLEATVAAGVGSVSAYFLIQTGIIALIPAVNMVVAVVVGVALLALITTAIVAAVRTSFKHAKVADCEQKIANNHREQELNRQTFSQYQGTDRLHLDGVIANIEQHIAAQTPVIEMARSKAASSLNEAKSIQVTNAYNPGNNPNTMFFAPLVASSALDLPMSMHENAF